MSCALLGADELMHHAEQRLGIKAGGTTPDGLFTLQHAECQAACTEAPVPAGQLPLPLPGHQRRRSTALVDDLRAGRARRRDPAARHARPRSASTSRRPCRRRPPIPTTSPTPPAWIPQPESAERARHDRSRHRYPVGARVRRTGDRPQIVTSRFAVRGLATRSSATSPPAATTGCEAALAQAAGRRATTRSRTSTLLGRGGAGFPAGVKWGLHARRACGRATSWSTATRASPAPTRTAC